MWYTDELCWVQLLQPKLLPFFCMIFCCCFVLRFKLFGILLNSIDVRFCCCCPISFAINAIELKTTHIKSKSKSKLKKKKTINRCNFDVIGSHGTRCIRQWWRFPNLFVFIGVIRIRQNKVVSIVRTVFVRPFDAWAYLVGSKSHDKNGLFNDTKMKMKEKKNRIYFRYFRYFCFFFSFWCWAWLMFVSLWLLYVWKTTGS